MYVTRPLSLYNSSPSAALDQPPEGPNSGILVVTDEAAKAEAVCCWGLCKDPYMHKLPFTQDRMVTVEYTIQTGQAPITSRDNVFFIPVINQPLSSNQYYVIRTSGRHKGKACACSKEEDTSTFCFCKFASDVKPRPFNYSDIYQQVEIICHKKHCKIFCDGVHFQAKSVASDGIPPRFLKRKGWDVCTSVPKNYSLGEALGLNTSLRTQMPDLNFQISTKHSPSMDVGKWYCPFIFVKDGEVLGDQMQRSMFYEMTLQQFWEEIYTRENYQSRGKAVKVGAIVTREVALLNGTEYVDIVAADGAIWFESVNSVGRGLGLSLPLWERMRWEEERGGWVGGEEKVERVEKMEVYEGEGEWRKFGCYVLVERFVLKRMDGSLALTYEFKHTNKIQIKWE